MVMARTFLGGLDIPLQARALDTDGKMVKGNDFLTPRCKPCAFSSCFHEQDRVLLSGWNIERVEERRMAPFTVSSQADHVRKNLFRIFIFADDDVCYM